MEAAQVAVAVVVAGVVFLHKWRKYQEHLYERNKITCMNMVRLLLLLLYYLFHKDCSLVVKYMCSLVNICLCSSKNIFIQFFVCILGVE